MKLLPVSLNVVARRCVIFGGGPVALRKAQTLRECGAQIVVIAPHFCDDWAAYDGEIMRETRVYAPGDCAGAALVFVCTNKREVNRQIVAEAHAAGIWCNVADAPETGDFHSAAAVRRGDITVSIATGGSSPALARHLREKIEGAIGPEYEALLEMLGEHRASLTGKIGVQSERAEFWRAILNGPVLQLLRQGKRDEAEELVHTCFAQININADS